MDWEANVTNEQELKFAHKMLDQFKQDKGAYRVTFSELKEGGSQSMLNTWMRWMGEVAAFMANAGCTMPLYIDSTGKHHGKRAFGKDDAHELFTARFLGTDAEGRRKSWSRRPPEGQVKADKGDKLWCMDQMLDFATERGIRLTIPRDSEYQREKDNSNGKQRAA